MSATAVTYSPVGSYPPTPPNTVEARSRANSSISTTTVSEPSGSSNMTGSHDRRRPPRNVAFTNIAGVLSQIVEEQPGRFFEGETLVPDNTPYGTEVGTDGPSTPRRRPVSPSEIDEALQDLPKPAPSSKPSPAPSVFGSSAQSSISEPLMIAFRPREKSSSTAETATNVQLQPPTSASKASTACGHQYGTREYSDWAQDTIQDVHFALLRVARLANDNWQVDPSVDQQTHYRRILSSILNGEEVKFPYGDLGEVAMPSSEDTLTPTKQDEGTGKAKRNELINLSSRVQTSEQRINCLSDLHNVSVRNVKSLQKKFENQLGMADNKTKAVVDEVNALKEEIAQLKKAMEESKGKGT